jgi:hypothetical protein
MYKQIRIPPNQINEHAIQRISDGAFIPFDTSNLDYQTYLKWLDGYEWQMIEPMKMDWVKTADNNTPLPADE